MSSLDRDSVTKRILIELDRKNEFLVQQMNEIRESLLNDSKNTAGDKHETSRAMVHLEQERLGKQLQESEKNISSFLKLKDLPSNQTVQLGSLVITDQYLIFVGVGLGIVKMEQTDVFVISKSAPLAGLIIGKKKGDTIIWNGQQLIIREIL